MKELRLSYIKGLGTGIIFTCGLFFILNFVENKSYDTNGTEPNSIILDNNTLSESENVDKHNDNNLANSKTLENNISDMGNDESPKDKEEDTNFTPADNIDIQNISNETKDEIVKIVIPEGYGSRETAKLFYDNGLVESFESFDAFIIINDKDYHIRYGTFEIPMNSTHEEILSIITKAP